MCRRLDAGEELGVFVSEPGRRYRLAADAAALAGHHPAAGLRPALFAAPVGVKDVVNVAGLPTAAGSTLPPELFAGPEAPAVTRLRKAGTLIAGKTATTELAFSEPAPTTNPHDPRRTPGGSSSGSAAAVAAGVVPLAIGTQTVDSIVTPAAYCGAVGFKPSYGRIPTGGVVPSAPSMDHVGVLAVDVAAAAAAAAVMCDRWAPSSTTAACTIGVPSEEFLDRAGDAARAIFESKLAKLEGAGLAVVHTEALAAIEDICRNHRRLVAAQFARVHAAWFDVYRDRYRVRTAALVEEGAALGEAEVSAGIESSQTLCSRLHETMSRLGIDLWASPAATGIAPRGLGFIGDPVMATPWTHAHLPVITIPAGHITGLPLGLQLAGRFGADEELVAQARRVEAIIGGD